MKKQLLPLVLFFSISFVSGQNKVRFQKEKFPVDKRAESLALYQNEIKFLPPLPNGPIAIAEQQKPAQPISINWSLLCGSMNVYGMIGAQQRPLQYNPQLNAVSFVHRKSTSYSVSPGIPSAAESGVMVGEISSNWGTTWDSTAMWSNATNWGRYPQGGIYNPPGNTSISNAYIVGSGESVDANDFNGVWYASKKLNVFNNSASSTPGAQQFFSSELSNANLYPANMGRHAWTRNGFFVSNDGVVHAMGLLGNDLKGLPEVRGYAIVTGTLNTNTNTFDWKMDSIVPPAVVESNGYSKALNEGQMIWNPAGTIGYVVGIGVLNGASGANRSMQPIIYKLDKTLNASATWTLMSGLDFNTTFTTIPYHLPSLEVTYPILDTTALPSTSDFNITIDANNNLHIGIIFMSGYSTHPDSLQYYSRFVSKINPTESYKWQHLPGDRPYIYDFIGNGVAPWKMVVVDSVSTEGPGIISSQSGYSENPWDNSGPNGEKIPLDARLMLGVTPNGQYISFCWAESDTLFTNSQLKYNNLPDVKARLMAVASGTKTYQMNNGVEINLSYNDNNVRTRATLHYMSPTISSATVVTGFSTAYTVNVKVPVSITNSNPYSQLTNNSTWFGNANLSFGFGGFSTGDPPPPTTITVNEYSGNIKYVDVFPNPTNDAINVKVESSANENILVKVENVVGQIVIEESTHVVVGKNDFKLDVSKLPAGIYLISINSAAAKTTKKIIIE